MVKTYFYLVKFYEYIESFISMISYYWNIKEVQIRAFPKSDSNFSLVHFLSAMCLHRSCQHPLTQQLSVLSPETTSFLLDGTVLIRLVKFINAQISNRRRMWARKLWKCLLKGQNDDFAEKEDCRREERGGKWNPSRGWGISGLQSSNYI